MRWWAPLGLLAAIRVAIPLAAYADEGSSLPGLPAFSRRGSDGGLTGDATGFYAATREFMAAFGRMPRIVLALDALLALAALVAIVALWRRRPGWRPWLAAVALCAFGLVVAVDVHWMEPSGAAVFGWPLVWALPLLAYHALGLGLSKHVAWDVGVAPYLPLDDFYFSPLKVLEYMAVGLCPVASDLGDLPALLGDGGRGLLVPADTRLRKLGRWVSGLVRR